MDHHIDSTDEGPSPVGIALSGGGTRAAMMGVGSIRRLYELGILRRATTISSVSGGSLVNAVLAMNWVELMATEGVDLDLFDRLIACPVRRICSSNLGMHVVGHKMNPVRMVKRVKSKIRKELGYTPTHLGLHLAKYIPEMDIKLSELPKPKYSLQGGVPRFVFCGCDLSTGKPFYFTQEIVGHGLSKDQKFKTHSGAYPILSEELTHAIPLTQAVGASSAVPLVFEPLQLSMEVNDETFTVGIVDGAVYDNLGLEPLIGEDNAVMLDGCSKTHKVLFVNDAGAPWFLPLDRFSGKHVVKRVTRSLTIALSRGHDERVRFLDLMYKRKLLYGAYWRLGDLEKIYDKFTEEEISAMHDLCFPAKQMFDPLLISRILQFRTDLNELKPAEIRVLENSGYILAAFKFHRYVVPALRDKNLVDTQNFTAVFRFPFAKSSNSSDDNSNLEFEIEKLTAELKNSYSLVKSNITLKPKRLRRKRSAFECQFQIPRHLSANDNDNNNIDNNENNNINNENGPTQFEQQLSNHLEGIAEETDERENNNYNDAHHYDRDSDNKDAFIIKNNNKNGEDHVNNSESCNFPSDPNNPIYKAEPSKDLYKCHPNSTTLLNSGLPAK